MAHSRSDIVVLCALGVLLSPKISAGKSLDKPKHSDPTQPRPGIISPDYPLDSEGDTVYTVAIKDRNDIPIAGQLIMPVVIKTAEPDFPQSVRDTRKTQLVKLTGVVDVKGRFIDLKPEAGGDPAADPGVF